MKLICYPLPNYRPFALCRGERGHDFVWRSDEKWVVDLPPLDAFRLAEKLKLTLCVREGASLRKVGRHDPNAQGDGAGAFIWFGRDFGDGPFTPVCRGELLAFDGSVYEHDEVIRDAGDIASVVQYLCAPFERQAVAA